MIRFLSLLALLGLAGSSFAQTSPLLRPGSTTSLVPAAATSPTRNAAKPPAAPSDTAERKSPTEITASEEATFDEKTRKAIFIGTVHVDDVQFILDCDKLTAFLKKAPDKSEAASPAEPAKKGESGLERAIAEGNVVIVQDKAGAPGEKPTKYIAKSERAEFEASTGDMRLMGNPQVQQGINTHVSLEPTTVMILNRNGTMRTEGKSKTVIQDQATTEKSTRP